MRRTLAEIPYTIEITLLLVIHALALQLQIDCDEVAVACTARNPLLSALSTRYNIDPLTSATLIALVLFAFAAYTLSLHLRHGERETRRNMLLILAPVVLLYGWTALVIAQPPIGPLTTLVLALDALRLHYKVISLQSELASRALMIRHLTDKLLEQPDAA